MSMTKRGICMGIVLIIVMAIILASACVPGGAVPYSLEMREDQAIITFDNPFTMLLASPAAARRIQPYTERTVKNIRLEIDLHIAGYIYATTVIRRRHGDEVAEKWMYIANPINLCFMDKPMNEHIGGTIRELLDMVTKDGG